MNDKSVLDQRVWLIRHGSTVTNDIMEQLNGVVAAEYDGGVFSAETFSNQCLKVSMILPTLTLNNSIKFVKTFSPYGASFFEEQIKLIPLESYVDDLLTGVFESNSQIRYELYVKSCADVISKYKINKLNQKSVEQMVKSKLYSLYSQSVVSEFLKSVMGYDYREKERSSAVVCGELFEMGTKICKVVAFPDLLIPELLDFETNKHFLNINKLDGSLFVINLKPMVNDETGLACFGYYRASKGAKWQSVYLEPNTNFLNCIGPSCSSEANHVCAIEFARIQAGLPEGLDVIDIAEHSYLFSKWHHLEVMPGVIK